MQEKHPLALRLKEVWNNSKIVAWSLVLGGMVLALWTIYYPQSPGVSIGILAMVAGIMSLRPEMHVAEKMAWILLLVSFAYLEVRAIGISDRNNEDVRDKQNAEFNQIAMSLKMFQEQSRDQFKDTMKGVTDVFGKTEQVADTATDAVNSITGGRSFCYVQAEFGSKEWVTFVILTRGKFPLHNVDFELVDDDKERELLTKHEFSPYLRNQFVFPQPNIPFLTSTSARSAGEYPIAGVERRSLSFNFYSANGRWSENLSIRLVNGNWTQAISVIKEVHNKIKVIYEYADPNFPKVDGKLDW